jgi:hypothetical protein
MNDQQSNKSSEQDYIEKLKYRIKDLGDLLNKFYRKVQEKANLPEIEGSTTLIDLYCYKPSNKPMWCEYNIKTHLYSKDGVIMCYSDMSYLPSEIKCTKHNKLFELFDTLQTISFLESIKEKILDMYDILYPGVLENLGNQYIAITVGVHMDPKEPIKENPEISKSSNKFIYNNGRSIIKMFW